MISGKTKITGLFGNPIEHSLSPQIHNKAFELLKLDYVYLAFNVIPENLENAVLGIRGMNFVGINVTIPHKQQIMQYLDEFSEEARFIGAVNTVKNTNGCISGHTTDTEGFIKSADEAGVSIKNKKVLILGGGGAARSIALGLSLRSIPATITLLGRTVSKVEEVAREITKKTNVQARGEKLNNKNLQDRISENEVLVNATSIGMHPSGSESPVPKQYLREGLIVYDIVYNPLETALIKAASSAGCIIIDGLGMLIHQAIASFNIWTGLTPESAPLRKHALKFLHP